MFGSIVDGVFEGKIITSRDSYYVEKRKHYFPNQTDSNNDLNFHSIIYKEDHVDDPYRHLRKGKCCLILNIKIKYDIECTGSEMRSASF